MSGRRSSVLRLGVLLAVGAAGLAIAFSISAENVTGGRSDARTATASQLSPAIAAFDGGFWLVWADRRRGADFSDLYGARVKADGSVLDPANVALVTAPLEQASPCLACGPASCLLLWDERATSSMRAMPLTFDGNTGSAFDPTGSTGGSGGVAAWAADRFFIAWEQGSDLYGRFVDSAGNATSPVELLVSQPGSESYYALAGNQNRFLLAWVESTSGADDLWYLLIDADGGVAAGPTRQGPNVLPSTLGVTATDGGFAISYFDVTSSPWALTVQRVDLGAMPVGGPAVADRIGINYGTPVSAASIGDEVAALETDGNVVGVYVSPFDGGSTLGLYSPTPHDVVSASSSDGLVFAWSESAAGITQVRFTSLAQALADGGSFLVSQSSNAQRWPKASSDGRAFLSAFNDIANPGIGVWAVQLDPNGAAQSVPFAVTPVSDDNDWLELNFFDGQRHWVGWHSRAIFNRNGPLYLAPVGASVGQRLVLDPNANYLEGASAAAGAGVSFVVWSAYPLNDVQALYFARLDQEGNLLEPPAALLLQDSKPVTRPSVQFARGAFHVFYERNAQSIAVRRWAPNGALLDVDAGVGLVNLTEQDPPFATATDGDRVLLVWADTGGVRAARIEGTQRIDTTPLVVAAPLAQTPIAAVQPTAVYDGQSFLVGWQEASADAGQQGRVRRVFPDGTLGPTTVAAAGPDDSQDFGLTAGSPGRVLAQYGRFDPAKEAVRLRNRVLAEVPVGGYCTSNAECGSGECGGPNSVCCSGGTCPVPLPDGGIPGTDSGDGGSTDGGQGGAKALRVGCGCDARGSGGFEWALLSLLAYRCWRAASSPRAGAISGRQRNL